MSRIYLPLLLVQLLLQFASVAYGSSGAGLWNSLANEVEVQGGTVTAGSEGAGVAAEGPLGPGQMRSGDVVQTAASNAEMQKTRLLQQQKRQLVGSIVSPIMSFVVLMLLYFFAYISFVAIFSQYFRFKVLSLVKYLAQKLHGAEQLNSEQPERKLRQEEQPGSEVDVASTESSR
ncbi:hypothetical protein, conserved [Eimeria maxima]|uniref:Transmembrane protein n=1 Tax=Eimeria maxima TaxID=5804 RepID=U6M7T5_EIMMA|nr:hypothetical protein, conserved [Eimeria maxima]CDJ60282.1 hypothetical protein, conserved [Eimeria maxima]